MDLSLVLLATDGSPSAKRALNLACDLVSAKSGKLLVVHVQRRHGGNRVPEELQYFSDVEQKPVTEAEAFRLEAQRIVDDASATARERGVKDVETAIAEGDPTQRIVELARNRGADAVVVGSRGLGGLEGLLLGSVSHKIAQLAPCTCIVVR
jgi:nucleotide-binding universal stress UspA family protein